MDNWLEDYIEIELRKSYSKKVQTYFDNLAKAFSKFGCSSKVAGRAFGKSMELLQKLNHKS